MAFEDEVGVFNRISSQATEGNDVLRPHHELHHFIAISVLCVHEHGEQAKAEGDG